VRKLASVVVTAGLLVSLSACAGSPFSPAGCTPDYTAGSNSALVSAKGSLGKDPKTDFPTPIVSKTSQASVVIDGEGDLVAKGAAVDAQISIYDAKSGELVISTDYSGAGLRLLAAQGQPAFGALAECVTVGSRVVGVGPAGELIGQASIDQNSIPLTVDDTVVLVVDVIRSFLGRANGADQPAQAGFPSIVLAPDGRPGFTIPSADAPTDLKIATLKAGNGATVKEGDSVVLAYTGVLWDTKKVFDSTWENGAPTTLTASSMAENADGSGLVPGFAEALIGAKVGSQVIVVIPPKFGYPTGSAPASIPDGATMVFVFDVLGIE
jgi:peptidylprolyl isomerase